MRQGTPLTFPGQSLVGDLNVLGAAVRGLSSSYRANRHVDSSGAVDRSGSAEAGDDAVFVVKVTKDGSGVSGSASADCTYTYTVKDLAGVTLGAALTPQTPRLHYVAYWYAGETRTAPAVATSIYGLACWDADTLVLLHCFGEIAKDDPC